MKEQRLKNRDFLKLQAEVNNSIYLGKTTKERGGLLEGIGRSRENEGQEGK